MKKTINRTLVVLLIFVACIMGVLAMGASAPQNAYAAETSEEAVVERKELGYAINVVTAQYLDDIKASNMVLDSKKIDNLTFSKFTRNTTPAAVAYTSSNITDIAVKYSTAVGITAESQNMIGLVSGNFDMAANFSFSNYAYKFFMYTIKKL